MGELGVGGSGVDCGGVGGGGGWGVGGGGVGGVGGGGIYSMDDREKGFNWLNGDYTLT